MEQAVTQLQDDFKRIQILNTFLGRSVLGNNVPDLKFVARSASEIKRRAERLNINLALPEPGASTEHPQVFVVASREQLKWSVLRLVKLVFSFVDNPFFKEASVVDTRVTAKARRDLEGIIKLSEQLKKDTEKLDKARQKGDH